MKWKKQHFTLLNRSKSESLFNTRNIKIGHHTWPPSCLYLAEADLLVASDLDAWNRYYISIDLAARSVSATWYCCKAYRTALFSL